MPEPHTHKPTFDANIWPLAIWRPSPEWLRGGMELEFIPKWVNWRRNASVHFLQIFEASSEWIPDAFGCFETSDSFCMPLVISNLRGSISISPMRHGYSENSLRKQKNSHFLFQILPEAASKAHNSSLLSTLTDSNRHKSSQGFTCLMFCFVTGSTYSNCQTYKSSDSHGTIHHVRFQFIVSGTAPGFISWWNPRLEACFCGFKLWLRVVHGRKDWLNNLMLLEFLWG